MTVCEQRLLGGNGPPALPASLWPRQSPRLGFLSGHTPCAAFLRKPVDIRPHPIREAADSQASIQSTPGSLLPGDPLAQVCVASWGPGWMVPGLQRVCPGTQGPWEAL